MSEQLTAAEQFRKMLPAEKFEVLLKSVQTLDLSIAELHNRQQTIIDTLGLLYQHLKALMLVMNVSDQTIQSVVEQMESQELASKVDGLKEKGILEDDQDGSVSEDSFVVLRVLKDGKVHTNRAQAPVKMMSEDVRKALIGLKRGDSTAVNDLLYEVVEIYRILEQQAS